MTYRKYLSRRRSHQTSLWRALYRAHLKHLRLRASMRSAIINTLLSIISIARGMQNAAYGLASALRAAASSSRWCR